MAIYRISAVLSTGLLAATLLMGGCNTGSEGSLVQGPAGAPGADGLTPTVLPVFKTTPLKVSCRFDYEDADHAARLLNPIRVIVEATDSKFAVISGVVKGDSLVDSSTGWATVTSPEGFDKVTCVDTTTGNTVVSYVNLTSEAAPVDGITVDRFAEMTWGTLIQVFRRGGYLANSSWKQADMAAVETAARADNTLDADWSAGTNVPAVSGAQKLVRDAHVRDFIFDQGGLIQNFAKAPVCLASVAPAASWGTTGSVVDAQNIGDADFQAENSAFECEITEFNGTAAAIVYTMNGLANTDADGDTVANISADITCAGLDSTNTRLLGVVASSTDSGLFGGFAEWSWYFVRLYSGEDTADASHVVADAGYYGLALNCSADTVADCKMLAGSKIDLTLGAAGTLYCDSQDDFATLGACTVDANTTAFVTSATTRDAQTGSSVVKVIKNCAPSEDTAFAYTPGSGKVVLSLSNTVTVADAGVAANGHIGFVVAELNPANTAQYNALLRLAARNSISDPVTAFSHSLINYYDELGSIALTPMEAGIALASGNGLCDSDLTELSDPDFVIGAKTAAKPNIAVAGLPFGEKAEITCGSADAVDRWVDENGIVTQRCDAVAGDVITVSAGDATDVTCTVE